MNPFLSDECLYIELFFYVTHNTSYKVIFRGCCIIRGFFLFYRFLDHYSELEKNYSELAKSVARADNQRRMTNTLRKYSTLYQQNEIKFCSASYLEIVIKHKLTRN